MELRIRVGDVMRRTWKILILIGTVMLITSCSLITGKQAEQEPRQIDTLSQASVREAHASTTQEEMQATNLENLRLKETIEQLSGDLNATRNYQEELSRSIERLIKASDEAVLRRLAMEEWSYTLRVNNLPIGSEQTLSVAPGELLISFSEQRPTASVLPQELLKEARLSDNYREELKVSSEKEYVLGGRDGTTVTSAEYAFSDVQPGDLIMLELSDALMERLNTDIKQYTIKVN